MKGTLVRRVITLALIASAAVATGCGRSAPSRFYVLAPLAELETPRPAPTRNALKLGIRRVSLPDYLDRPQIVTRIGPSQLALADFDRWAGPLADDFPRVLAENLGLLLPSEHVVVFPWARGVHVDYELIVEVSQFEGRLGGDCALVARWSVYAREKRTLVTAGKSTLTERATGDDYDALVQAQSRLVGALSKEIVAALGAAVR